MDKRPQRLAALPASIAIDQFAVYGGSWILDTEVRMHSKETQANRRLHVFGQGQRHLNEAPIDHAGQDHQPGWAGKMVRHIARHPLPPDATFMRWHLLLGLLVGADHLVRTEQAMAGGEDMLAIAYSLSILPRFPKPIRTDRGRVPGKELPPSP